MKKIRTYRKDETYYDQDAVDTAFFCPDCGKQTVVRTDSGGDYYVGETHYCETCTISFHIPSAGDNDSHMKSSNVKVINVLEKNEENK